MCSDMYIEKNATLNTYIFFRVLTFVIKTFFEYIQKLFESERKPFGRFLFVEKKFKGVYLI